MKINLSLLLFISLVFSGCEDKQTGTYSIIGLWERESISLSSVDDPSLNVITLSDSSNYDFIRFNSDMSFSSYGFAITNYSNNGNYQLLDDLLTLNLQDSISSNPEIIEWFFDVNDNNLTLSSNMIDSLNGILITINIEMLYKKND